MSIVDSKNLLSEAEKLNKDIPAHKPLRGRKKKSPFAKEFKLSDSRKDKSTDVKSFTLSRSDASGKNSVLRDRNAVPTEQKKPVLRDRNAVPAEQKRPVLHDRNAVPTEQKKPVLHDRNAVPIEDKAPQKAKPLTSVNDKPMRENSLGRALEKAHENSVKNPDTAQKPVQAQAKKTPVRIFALGGLGEIGKNLYVYECSNDMFIIDCGLAFPDEDMLGVDLVIPDFTYLEKNKEHFRGGSYRRSSLPAQKDKRSGLRNAAYSRTGRGKA